MSLEPGSRLANCKILESIGAGGMGEVYRARDQKLGRKAKLLAQLSPAVTSRIAS